MVMGGTGYGKLFEMDATLSLVYVWFENVLGRIDDDGMVVDCGSDFGNSI